MLSRQTTTPESHVEIVSFEPLATGHVRVPAKSCRIGQDAHRTYILHLSSYSCFAEILLALDLADLVTGVES